MNRREFFGVGALAAASCRSPGAPPPPPLEGTVRVTRDDGPPAPPCQRMAHQTAGPFYVAEPIARRDIREGQRGRPLLVRFSVASEQTCSPLAGVVISLFHANSEGLYSGFSEQGLDRDKDTSGQTWLRGAQTADSDGRVEFVTVYPGWYVGRVTHMHLTASLEGELIGVTQVYFPDDQVRRVYAEQPYRGWRDTEDKNDSVIRRVRSGLLPRLSIERGVERDVGDVSIVVRT